MRALTFQHEIVTDNHSSRILTANNHPIHQSSSAYRHSQPPSRGLQRASHDFDAGLARLPARFPLVLLAKTTSRRTRCTRACQAQLQSGLCLSKRAANLDTPLTTTPPPPASPAPSIASQVPSRPDRIPRASPLPLRASNTPYPPDRHFILALAGVYVDVNIQSSLHHTTLDHLEPGSYA